MVKKLSEFTLNLCGNLKKLKMGKEFRLGKDIQSGDVVYIAAAQNGLKCNCVCFKCNLPLIAAQGSKNEWHFKHKGESNCKGGQETAIHKLVKQIIIESKEIELPYYGTIIYKSAIQEKDFDPIRPDVTITTEKENIYFEVVVTNPVSASKEMFFKKGEYKSVELDFRNYEFTSIDTLKEDVLKKIDNKRIIFWESVPVTNSDNGVFWFFACILFLLGLLYHVNRKNLSK